LLCHGSPSSDTTYLLEDVSHGRPLVRPDSEIRRDLGDSARFPVVLCGHTHVPRLVQLGAAGPLILNPGSIGLPAYDDDTPIPHFMETFSPHASYAVLEKRSRGWSASFHRVPYDSTAAANRARELGRNDWAQGIQFGRMS
jgi:diadenosine tetraphosphatase ApaH/serine/threonine PP2A family protein phosphatase